jgi:aspartate beta-hydroxylase
LRRHLYATSGPAANAIVKARITCSLARFFGERFLARHTIRCHERLGGLLRFYSRAAGLVGLLRRQQNRTRAYWIGGGYDFYGGESETMIGAEVVSYESPGVLRFNSYLRSFKEGADPGQSCYPGLSSRAFHDPPGFPIVRALEDAYDAIRSEVLSLGGSAFHPEIEDVERTGSWEVLHLFERGRKNLENCALCPVTVQLIETHATVRTLAGLSYISKMNPGTHIAAHRGPTNLRLRCHLGIQVPEGPCGLRVGNEEGCWREGKCIIFDDSLEHESWNRTALTRIVLIVDLWHPDLAPAEIALLQSLHYYASAQAEALTRYWLANRRARNTRPLHYD